MFGFLQALSSVCCFSVSSPMFEFGRRSLFLCLPIFLPAILKGAKWFLKIPVVSTCISIKMLYRASSLVFVSICLLTLKEYLFKPLCVKIPQKAKA